MYIQNNYEQILTNCISWNVSAAKNENNAIYHLGSLIRKAKQFAAGEIESDILKSCNLG